MKHTRQRGTSLLYTIVILLVLLGFASFAVDVGRLQLAKTEARRAADAAAHAGASALYQSVASARSAAIDLAAANLVDGQAVALDPAQDIEFGLWDASTREFKPLSEASRHDANAVRVSVRRTAERGNAIPLLFAGVIGQGTCDLKVSAVAANQTRQMLQLVGLDEVTVKNNFFGGTYSSNSLLVPTHDTAGNGASVASNSDIWAKMNEKISTTILGPGGTSNLDLASEPFRLSQEIAVQMPSWSTVGTDLEINGTKTLSGGTHYFRNVTLSNHATLRFSGPATVYVSGVVKFEGDATIAPTSGVPGDLKIYQQGNGDFGTATANNLEITADVWAPGADFSAKNNALLRGRMLFRTILVKNNLDYYYDLQLAPPLYTSKTANVAIVQ